MAFLKRRGSHQSDRHSRAQDRAEERSKRSSEQQLAVLNTRLGKGVGATKERARLSK